MSIPIGEPAAEHREAMVYLVFGGCQRGGAGWHRGRTLRSKPPASHMWPEPMWRICETHEPGMAARGEVAGALVRDSSATAGPGDPGPDGTRWCRPCSRQTTAAVATRVPLRGCTVRRAAADWRWCAHRGGRRRGAVSDGDGDSGRSGSSRMVALVPEPAGSGQAMQDPLGAGSRMCRGALGIPSRGGWVRPINSTEMALSVSTWWMRRCGAVVGTGGARAGVPAKCRSMNGLQCRPASVQRRRRSARGGAAQRWPADSQ